MPDRIVRAVLDRLNDKRGRFLALNAIMYLCIGYSYFTNASLASRSAAFGWLPLPTQYLGWVWIAAAVIALLSAVSYSPPRSDRLGFMVLTAVPMLWAFGYLFAWAAGYSEAGWVSAAIYGLIAGVALLCSSWANPNQTVLRLHEEYS